MIDKFNIRVYGILLKDNKILVSHENIDGFSMTKLPGGGLEFGEGPVECLIREFKEELDVTIRVKQLLHTTENFVQSFFKKNEQLLAIHYLVESDDEIANLQTTQATNLGRKNIHKFEWVELENLNLKSFTFDMDKLALNRFLELI
jgi:8-oxo-dGTP diphosphatase